MGIVILSACGALCAFFLNQSATVKCEQTEYLLRFARFVKNQVECFGLTSKEIISECESELLEGCGFYNCPCECGFEFLARECQIYDEESERLSREFLLGFGKSYRDEQIKECERYIAALSERYDQLLRDLPQKKKLNMTLCLAGALCLGLMLI